MAAKRTKQLTGEPQSDDAEESLGDTPAEEDLTESIEKSHVRGSYYYDDATGYEVYNPAEEPEPEDNDDPLDNVSRRTDCHMQFNVNCAP